MPTDALALVLAAALVHAGWNLLAKRASDQPALLFLATVAAAALSLPAALVGVARGLVPPAGLAAAAASALVHAGYFALLGAGYRRGDLSVVYPVARGSGPLGVALLAGPIFGEYPAPLGVVAIAAVVTGLVLVALAGVTRAGRPPGAPAGRPPAPAGLALGLAVGASSTAYSLIDRAGVSFVPPPVYLALQMLGTAVLMGPAWLGTKTGRARLGGSARRLAGPALLCAVGILGAYGLVLVAMTRAPVAYVAAGREIAIVFGIVLGALVLREPVTPARALGALLVTSGIILLALA